MGRKTLKLISVGRKPEPWLKEAFDGYFKRLQGRYKLEVVYLPNSKFETEISYGNGEKDIAYSNASLSKVLPSGSIVVIAGNIENISNLITDAEVLWERL